MMHIHIVCSLALLFLNFPEHLAPAAAARSGQGTAFHNLYSENLIAADNVVHTLHVGFADVAENGVAAVKMRCRAVRYKPLRPAGVLSRKRHADCASVVFAHVYLA